MNTISITYQLKWRIKNSSYCITKCKKVINTKTNRVKKKCVNNGVVGYWIGREFISLDRLNSLCEKINLEYCPF